MKADTVRTRFAPSPTGHLHLGHLYAAQVAHDFAREHNGEYLLRFEDIDTTRIKDKYYQSILSDLSFFGFTHDAPPLSQIFEERKKAHVEALSRLDQLGVLYPCFCSRKDIERELATLTNAPHEKANHYPGTCRNLSTKQKTEHLACGRIPSIRINIEKAKAITGELSFTDLIHGDQQVDHHMLGDCILSRKDIGNSYHIASIDDDAYQSISHVTRGNDLLASTHLHRVLQALLGYPEPTYLHHPLILDLENKRLAKRSNSTPVHELVKAGYSKEQLQAIISQQLNSQTSHQK